MPGPGYQQTHGARPFGQARTQNTVATAGSDWGGFATAAAAAARQGATMAAAAAAAKARQQAAQDALDKARAQAQQQLQERMTAQREAQQKLRAAQDNRRQTEKTAKGRADEMQLRASAADQEAAARNELLDARHGRHKAQQKFLAAKGKQQDEAPPGSPAAAEKIREHDVADKDQKRKAMAAELEKNGYQVVYAPGERTVSKDGKTMHVAKHGDILGVTEKYDNPAVYTPQEIIAGKLNWKDASLQNAAFFDPHNPNGMKFVDVNGNIGQVDPKTGHLKPYTFDDFYQGATGNQTKRQLGLRPFQAQGPVFVSDQGETTLEAPHLGAFGLPEGGVKVKGTYKTFGEQLAEYASWEKTDPARLKDLQMKMFNAGLYGNAAVPGKDPAPTTGVFDSSTNAAIHDMLLMGTTQGVLTHDDINTFLKNEAASVSLGLSGGGGGGGGGGAAPSWSATDPSALRMYAEQAARAVLGRNPTDQETQAAIQQVQASETAEGQKKAGAIINTDPQAKMVEYFRAASPAEFQAKNTADAVGMFSKMIGEGGLLGTGMSGSGIGQGNGSGA